MGRDPQNLHLGLLFNILMGLIKGCQIDYRGESLSLENLLAILKCEVTKVKLGSGRVLMSTKSSKCL